MSSTPQEQLLLELINDARLNPTGDAARYMSGFSPAASHDPDVQNALSFFHVDGATLKQQLAGLTAAQPLAFNDTLASTARAHDDAMIHAGSQDHQLPGEAGLLQRAQQAGYNPTKIGENIFASVASPLEAHAAFMIDWGSGPGGMQSPAGHRTNIMDPAFREVGIGYESQPDASKPVGPNVVTEDFGMRGNAGTFILGVAYNDADHNGFYSVGEGVGGLNVAVGGTSATSSSSGGYSLSTTASGPQTVTLTGAGLKTAVSVKTDLEAGQNIKLDVIGGHVLHTSASASVSGGVDTIVGLGTHGLSLTAGSGAQTIVGTDGSDTINGGSGRDVIMGGGGSDLLTGGKNGDRFVFTAATGTSTITDFLIGTSSHDRLDLSAFSQFSSVADVMRHTSMIGGNAQIDLGGQSRIVLDHVSATSLSAAPHDFIFHK